jgi:predicted permease
MGAIIGRFIFSPLCVLALLPIIPVSDMSMKVFLVQSGMPAMTNMTLIAKTAGADVAYSTALCFLTVILGMVFIPVCMLIL